jgi:hypothetical protein
MVLYRTILSIYEMNSQMSSNAFYAIVFLPLFWTEGKGILWAPICRLKQVHSIVIDVCTTDLSSRSSSVYKGAQSYES